MTPLTCYDPIPIWSLQWHNTYFLIWDGFSFHLQSSYNWIQQLDKCTFCWAHVDHHVRSKLGKLKTNSQLLNSLHRIETFVDHHMHVCLNSVLSNFACMLKIANQNIYKTNFILLSSNPPRPSSKLAVSLSPDKKDGLLPPYRSLSLSRPLSFLYHCLGRSRAH